MSVKSHLAALLATTALLATGAGAAPLLSHKADARHPSFPPSGLSVLYNQTSHDSGIGIVSQNFEATFDAYDCEAADDFIVPDGAKWRIKEVDVVGTYFDGSGKARSENVLFFKDRRGVPGKEKGRFEAVVGQDGGQGSFIIRLKPAVTLKPGHYWVSVQTNQDFNASGEWGWEASEVQANLPAVWRNPGGGFGVGCTDWGPLDQCIPGVSVDDLLFALRGHAFDLAVAGREAARAGQE